MSVRIGVGLAGFPFKKAESFWRWIDLCEATAIDSAWLNDRLISTEPLLEPLTALAAIAGRTKRLKFGMNAVVLPLRDPLVLAKECATIDYLSGGRLLPVFGIGNDTSPEWRATGQTATTRGAKSNEALQVLAKLWSQEHVTFEGKHFKYNDVTISPRPVQQPLPIWIGGNSEAAMERTARYGTGWLGGGGSTPAGAAKVVAGIKSRLSKYGREIEDDHYGAGVPFRFGSWEDAPLQRQAAALKGRYGADFDASQAFAVGGAKEIVALLDRFVEAGVSKFVLRPMGASDDEIIEQTQMLADEVVPLVHHR